MARCISFFSLKEGQLFEIIDQKNGVFARSVVSIFQYDKCYVDLRRQDNALN